MGVVLFFLTALLVLGVLDVRIRLLFLLAPDRASTLFDRLQYRGCWWIIRLARVYGGLKVILERAPGASVPSSALILANHQSLVDIPMLIYAFPGRALRFVAKRELRFGLPSFSVALRRGRHALIERRGGMRANERRLERLARDSSRNGWCPVIFPEGTRTRDVQPFHSAGVRMVERTAPFPVVTVALHGGYRIARLMGLILHLPGTVFRIRVLSCYPAPRDRQETMALLERARAEITDQVNQWKNQET